MSRRFGVSIILLLLVFGLLFVSSCGKKRVVSEPMVGPSEEETEAERLAAVREAEEARKALEEERRLEEERLREQTRAEREREEQAALQRFLNEHIHFEFDKSRLLPRAKEILRHNAKWLLAHPDVDVTIEGHCDERGTNEYNLALGDRRAQSAKRYLVDLGVDPERLFTVSYGEEKPLDPRHNEAAWAKNRRAQFVID
jgi:peptidoglycan-associated lipoprotein